MKSEGEVAKKGGLQRSEGWRRVEGVAGKGTQARIAIEELDEDLERPQRSYRKFAQIILKMLVNGEEDLVLM